MVIDVHYLRMLCFPTKKALKQTGSGVMSYRWLNTYWAGQISIDQHVSAAMNIGLVWLVNLKFDGLEVRRKRQTWITNENYRV